VEERPRRSEEAEAEEEEADEEEAPREETPKVRRWIKKWVSVGHLKLYKWVPLDGKAPPRKQAASVLQQQTSKSSAKEQKAALARTQRLLNDNAPITRSVTAAFKEKHKMEMEQRAKRRKTRDPSPNSSSRPTRSSSRIRDKETKEIFSKISEDNIITPARLTEDALRNNNNNKKRKASSLLEPDTTGEGPIPNALPATPSSSTTTTSTGGGDGALISSDAPLALPLPASLAGGYSRNHAKIVVEPRLY